MTQPVVMFLRYDANRYSPPYKVNVAPPSFALTTLLLSPMSSLATSHLALSCIEKFVADQQL